MKKTIYFLTVIVVSMSLVACGNVKKQNDTSSNEEGWVTLFDGSSFDGWRGYGRADMPGMDN